MNCLVFVVRDLITRNKDIRSLSEVFWNLLSLCRVLPPALHFRQNEKAELSPIGLFEGVLMLLLEKRNLNDDNNKN